MSLSSSIPYSPQIKIPELMERGKTQVSTLPIYRDGALVAPTQARYTLIAPDGSKLVNDAVATYPGNVPEYTHTPSILPETLNLGEGYLQEWTVTILGEVKLFRRSCAIVKRRLYPVVSDGDLTSTYSQLADIRPSSLSSYQTYIDEAWYTLIQKLRNEGGGLEYLVMSPEAFRSAHQNLTLYYIFRDFHSSLGQSNGRYLDLASEHFKQWHHDWKGINFVYDYDHSGTADTPNTRQAKQPVIYLTQTGGFRGRRK
tara:strand:- start:9191 stop:9958 length:768 start_codon:yes stop_codon:yes gene_type:complete